MSSSTKILALNLPRRRRAPSNNSSGDSLKDLSPRALITIIQLLRTLGYHFETLNNALKAPFGKFACLMLDGADWDLYQDLESHLKMLRVPATVFVAPKEMRRRQQTTHPLLTWEHLRQMCQQGWEIGCLPYEYVNLTEKSSRDQHQLITRAKTLLNERLGYEPQIFAYPYGAYDTTTISCIRDEGFIAAITQRRGVNFTATDPLQLKCLNLTGSNFNDILMILKAAFIASSPAHDERAALGKAELVKRELTRETNRAAL